MRIMHLRKTGHSSVLVRLLGPSIVVVLAALGAVGAEVCCTALILIHASARVPVHTRFLLTGLDAHIRGSPIKNGSTTTQPNQLNVVKFNTIR